MAEAALIQAGKKLAEFVGGCVIEKVKALNQVVADANWLEAEIGHVLAVRKDAEGKQHSHQVQRLLSDLNGIADRTVKVLEEFNEKMNSANIGGGAKKNSLDLFESARLYAYAFSKGSYGNNTFDIASEIGLIKASVEDIKRRKDTYSILNIPAQGESSASVEKRLRRTYSFRDAGELFVGFRDVKCTLLGELLKKQDLLSVVSIHGMGGSGKTALAKNLYYSPELTQHFSENQEGLSPNRAWVCISKEYNIEELLRSLIQSFNRNVGNEELTNYKMLKNMNEEDLVIHLRKILKDKAYLIVVDDLWNKEAWESLKRALPDDRKGSRVIVTTPYVHVAKGIEESMHEEELRVLNQHESWSLFMKKLSPPRKAVRGLSSDMNTLGKQMVAKCGGLPIAIVVLGGLLARKQTLEDWNKVKGNIWKDLAKETVRIDHLLSLSYNDLSRELQQCFLYVGSYPEDSLINTEELKYLWMGERFITREENEQMEEVANRHLDELIDRNLIQATHWVWGETVACRVHDLIRDLAMEKALGKNLFGIYHSTASSLTNFDRHIVHTHTESYLSLPPTNKSLHSLLLLNLEDRHLEISSFSFGTYQHLGVLKLVSVDLHSHDNMLPDSIGELIRLKVLIVLRSSLLSLPPSIGSLKCLEILEVENIESKSPVHLPPEASQLTNLRQLIAYVSGDADIGALSNLRVLKNIQYAHWIRINHESLVNLRELAIEDICRVSKETPYTLEHISKLKSLHTLVLGCSATVYGYEFPPLNFLSSCTSLRKLWLEGPIVELPPAEEWPKSITMLRLSETGGYLDPIPTVSKLPNLRRLDLHGFDVPDGTMNLGGFPELEVLSLSQPFTKVTGFTPEERPLPKIKRIYTFGVSRELEQQIREKFKRVATYEILAYALSSMQDIRGRG